ncbi:hypothetical protein GCM10023178_18990 [Actinomadura luteofluorescens]
MSRERQRSKIYTRWFDLRRSSAPVAGLTVLLLESALRRRHGCNVCFNVTGGSYIGHRALAAWILYLLWRAHGLGRQLGRLMGADDRWLPPLAMAHRRNKKAPVRVVAGRTLFPAAYGGG